MPGGTLGRENLGEGWGGASLVERGFFEWLAGKKEMKRRIPGGYTK